jgi:hypothetical protein
MRSDIRISGFALALVTLSVFQALKGLNFALRLRGLNSGLKRWLQDGVCCSEQVDLLFLIRMRGLSLSE